MIKNLGFYKLNDFNNIKMLPLKLIKELFLVAGVFRDLAVSPYQCSLATNALQWQHLAPRMKVLLPHNH